MERPLERRRFIRVLVNAPLSFAAPGGLLGVGEMRTLSIRGLSFVAGEVIKTGSPIRVSFSVGKNMIFELAGTVRHRLGRGSWKHYGVFFSVRDYRDLKEHGRLNEFIMSAKREQDALAESRLRKRRT